MSYVDGPLYYLSHSISLLKKRLGSILCKSLTIFFIQIPQILTFMRTRHNQDLEKLEEKDRIIAEKDYEISSLKENFQSNSGSLNSIVDFGVECEIKQENSDDPLK
jgi:hypothetical protein